MDNENKWEYDYSSQDKNESGDTGYPNVGSSGMNTANPVSYTHLTLPTIPLV